MITVYHNAQCSKSNSVCELLATHHVKAHIVEYLKTPLGKEDINALLTLLGMQPSGLIRRNEPVFIALYEGRDLTEEDYLQAMVLHPVLIERPIIVKEGKAIIGRPPEKVLSLL
ncbi:MAG TPA: ArsC/Spx/MgsR family protein [Flavipsychrobacter sp.]|nr:ArsC/Spx/MgsR family protein [Flavipsychrobacter sp.]